jgi:hypothetical protein
MTRDRDDLDVSQKPLSGLDSTFANTNIVVLILFALCCNVLCYLPLILSLIGVMTCTDEKAKSNARLCLIISAIVSILGTIGGVVNQMNNPGGGF